MTEVLQIVILLVAITSFVILSVMIIKSRRRIRSLESKLKEAQKVNYEKDSVIAIVSHDLKGPLNRIYALVNLVELSGDPLTEPQREYLQKMSQVVKEGLVLVKNILDIQKIEAGDTSVNHTNIDINRLLINLLNDYNQIAKYKGVEFEFSSQVPVDITGDLVYLERILENLLSNALKFSPVDEKVKVSTEMTGDNVTIRIVDFGESIPEEDLPRIFEKYSVLSPKPTAGESSTGLGMSIVKLLCDLLDYDISYHALEPIGSEFRVVIPVKVKDNYQSPQ